MTGRAGCAPPQACPAGSPSPEGMRKHSHEKHLSKILCCCLADQLTACLHKNLTSDRHLTQQNKPTTHCQGLRWEGWYEYTDSISNLTTGMRNVRIAMQQKMEDWKGRHRGDRNTTPAGHTQPAGNVSEHRRMEGRNHNTAYTRYTTATALGSTTEPT